MTTAFSWIPGSGFTDAQLNCNRHGEALRQRNGWHQNQEGNRRTNIHVNDPVLNLRLSPSPWKKLLSRLGIYDICNRHPLLGLGVHVPAEVKDKYIWCKIESLIYRLWQSSVWSIRRIISCWVWKNKAKKRKNEKTQKHISTIGCPRRINMESDVPIYLIILAQLAKRRRKGNKLTFIKKTKKPRRSTCAMCMEMLVCKRSRTLLRRYLGGGSEHSSTVSTAPKKQRRTSRPSSSCSSTLSTTSTWVASSKPSSLVFGNVVLIHLRRTFVQRRRTWRSSGFAATKPCLPGARSLLYCCHPVLITEWVDSETTSESSMRWDGDE